MHVPSRTRVVTWWQRCKHPNMSTTEGTSTTSALPVTLQATIATTISTTASVASPTLIAFTIQGIHPPSHLDVKENITENWKTFNQAWSNYAIIMNINQQPETYQIALFLHCIGPEALKIVNGMSFDNAQEKEKLENIVKKFNEFTIGETSETYKRYVFNSRNQSPDETFDAYVATLRTLSQTCNFSECIRESLIRDRIVLGIQNPQTRKRLLQERKLTLNKCIDICRSSETSASQMKCISGTKTSEDVNRVKENREPGSRPPNSKRKNSKNDKSRKSCLFCGGTHPFEKGKCRQCGGRNHFASKCKKSGKRVNNISSTDSPSSSVDDNEDIDYKAGIAVESANMFCRTI